MKIIRGIGIALAVLVVLGFAAAGIARLHDGPLGLLPGGPLVAGELADASTADWGSFRDTDTIELQLLEPARSRTTWILSRDGAAFIPCSLSFPPGKRWHQDALADGRAIVRIAGRRYAVTLERATDEDTIAALKTEVGRKYAGGPPGEGGVWFFRLVPRGRD